MELNNKIFKLLKTKSYVENNYLFFFAQGINRTSNDWLITEQKLKRIGLTYYKNVNKIASLSLEKSIFRNLKHIVSGPNFFIKPENELPEKKMKNAINNNLSSLLFNVLAVKVGNKIYTENNIKKIHSFVFNQNLLLLSQLNISHLKSYYKF